MNCEFCNHENHVGQCKGKGCDCYIGLPVRISLKLNYSDLFNAEATQQRGCFQSNRNTKPHLQPEDSDRI